MEKKISTRALGAAHTYTRLRRRQGIRRRYLSTKSPHGLAENLEPHYVEMSGYGLGPVEPAFRFVGDAGVQEQLSADCSELRLACEHEAFPGYGRRINGFKLARLLQ